jgi:hypothetical protein
MPRLRRIPVPDIQKLKALSNAELLKELRAREAKANNAALAESLEPNGNLSEFDSATIASVLKDNQKVIYGTDDRIDVFQLPAGADLDDVSSVVALFRDTEVTNNGNGTSTLRTENFGTSRNLCPGERFREQPRGAFCSGFLVAADIIATAGHCINDGNVTTVRFVFGFRMRDATTAETVINNGEIYSGVAIIGRQEVGDGPDWALVRIDRPVINHRIAPIRRAGRIGDSQAVHVIGHPSGLPTKFAGGAAVRNNQPNEFFVANLDTYGGNSGSPVFNSNTHEVEGILVRGESDFITQGTCRVSLVCPTTGCQGEECTRTTEFAQLVPVPVPPPVPAVVEPFGYAFINEKTGITEQHNLFRSADGHIHALWFNFEAGWHHEDRTSMLPGVPPAVGDPFGYAFINEKTGITEQHNLFRSADGHIHALWFNFESGWHHEDRTAMLAGVPPAVGDPFGYAFINEQTGITEQHNLFRSADGHIHALWFNFEAGWHHEDRTSMLPGVPPAVGDPFGYAFINEKTGITEQHNLFRSADGHIHALWFNFEAGWHHEDRTAMLDGVPPAVGDPFGYAFINEKTGITEQHNLFRTADGHIHALWFNFESGWHHEDRS